MGVIKTFVMELGERYCLLVDESSGLPIFFPNLYITTQVRNRSLSYSSMEAVLSRISVLMRYMDERDQLIETRFREAKLFEGYELDTIRDFCQIKFRARAIKEDSKSMFIFSELQGVGEKVSSQPEFARLTVVAQYLKYPLILNGQKILYL